MKIVIYNLTILSFLLMASIINAQTKETVFFEGFESGWGTWWADNGVWDVGIPTVEPVNTHSGINCAETGLNRNYPDNTNTRLISPQIVLPNTLPGEKRSLKFWHWYMMDNNPNDYYLGLIQISTDNVSSWETISGNFDEYSALWTKAGMPLIAYENSTVRFAFYFTSSDSETDIGWYIDDIRID